MVNTYTRTQIKLNALTVLIMAFPKALLITDTSGSEGLMALYAAPPTRDQPTRL